MFSDSLAAGSGLSDLALHLRDASIERWGTRDEVALVGRHESMLDAQQKLLMYAQADAPVLITGETGTGKELFARALYLLGARRTRALVTANCAQFVDGQMIASELFGHKRGSFTGAVEDRRGVFEEADGGVVFLDEVGELSLAAQAMLLRVLGQGEVVRVGETRARKVDVRVVAATNRDLRAMVVAGQFRQDLYFRLRFLQLHVAPLRERGDDWRLLAEHYLRELDRASGRTTRFSAGALARLAPYAWPGNVRELRGVVEASHCLCAGTGVIEPEAVEAHLEYGDAAPDIPAAAGAPTRGGVHEWLAHMREGAGTFWTVVHEPFMNRDLNRGEVREVIAEGLRQSNWSYKRALGTFGIDPADYLRFMDFLRHHRLKPEHAA